MADNKEPPRIAQSPEGGRLQAEMSAPGTLEAGLYLVATPIGNLRDITVRALDALGAADVIMAEDTRNTVKLLNAYGLKRPLKPYHDHNAAKQIPFILREIEGGKAVALVSDAGMPLVSDPGYKLVRAAVEAGYPVTALPGASAPVTALVLSALPSDKFLFAGFLPPKSAARKQALSQWATLGATLIFFETGPRLAAALSDIADVLGNRQAVIARELTKTYEELRRGTVQELLNGLADDPPRGEIVLLVAGNDGTSEWDEADIDAALETLIAEKGVKGASAHIAQQSGWPRRAVYTRALALKNKK